MRTSPRCSIGRAVSSGCAERTTCTRCCVAATHGDPDAAFAVEVMLHRFVALLGASAATLGGLDALVFTGGIGEHSHAFREIVTERSAWLGLAVTDRDDGEEITASGAAVRTFVVDTAEDLEMVRLLDEAGHPT